VECNQPAAPILQCGLGFRDFWIRRIRNGVGLETVERYTITSLEGDASSRAKAGRRPLIYAEVVVIVDKNQT
jgi:hypothetical protein